PLRNGRGSGVPRVAGRMVGRGRDRRNASGEDKPLAPALLCAGLLREPSVGDHGAALESAPEQLLVRRHDQARRLHAGGVGDHAVGRDDGMAFDAIRARHSRRAGHSLMVRTTDEVGLSLTVGSLISLATISSYCGRVFTGSFGFMCTIL